MKLGILRLLFLLLPAYGYGQDYPLIQTGTAVSDFVPKGWTLIQACSGDLNGDSLADVAFVVQKDDSIDTEDRNGSGKIISPRTMAVALKTSEGKLVLKTTNKSILINENSPPTFDDPFKSVTIENGHLTINFLYDYINGHFYYYEYKFHFLDHDFWLIEAESKYINRASMDYKTRSFDFISGKCSITTGIHETDDTDSQKVSETTRSFDLNKYIRKRLTDLAQPGTWKVTTDEWL